MRRTCIDQRSGRALRVAGRHAGLRSSVALLFTAMLGACSSGSAPQASQGEPHSSVVAEQPAQPKPPEASAPEAADPSASYMMADATLQEMVKAGGHVMPEKGKVSAEATPESRAVPEFDTAFQRVMAAYHTIRRALAADSVAGVKDAAGQIQEAASLLKGLPSPAVAPEEQKKLAGVLDDLGSAAAALAQAPDLKSSRDSLAVLTRHMMYIVAFHFHPAVGQEPRTYWCPMKNLAWFQDVPRMGNPYYGTEMLECGFKVAKGGS